MQSFSASHYVRVLALSVTVIVSCICSDVAFAVDAGACGEMPPVANDQLKGKIDGEAQLLSKYIGGGKLSGQIEISRRDIFLHAPEGAQAALDTRFFVVTCKLILDDKSLSTAQKLDGLRMVKQGFSIARPATGAIHGGWLRYAIGPCTRGGSVVHCEGVLESQENHDRVLGTFVTQTGGIRRTAFDHCGVITAVDDQSNTYTASRIQVGNRSNNQSGQFYFTLIPGLASKISIDFRDVDTSAGSFYRLTIPFADGGRASSCNIELVMSKISFTN